MVRASTGGGVKRSAEENQALEREAWAGRIEQLEEALAAGVDNVRSSIRRNESCPLCESSQHPDGHISHDEDCGLPIMEAALK